MPFANSWMLLWGAAALIPWLIHLWNRQRYQETSWAANHLLAIAIERSARRVRLQDILLLVIRTIILLLFAIALAEPIVGWFPLLGANASRQGDTHHVVVLDASYSMQFETEGESRFQDAQERAIDFIRTTQQGDGISLVLMADPPVVVISEPSFDRDNVIREIGRLKPSPGEANLTSTLAEVKQVLSASIDRVRRLQNHTVTIFSDLDTSAWEAAHNGASRDLFEWMNQGVAATRLVDVGSEEAANAWIGSFRIEEPIVSVAQPVQFKLQIHSNRQLANKTVPLELTVGGETIYRQILRFTGSAETKTINVNHSFQQAGEVQVKAQLGQDSLPLDDFRWLCLRVRKSIKTLVLRGKPGADRYVRVALESTSRRGPAVSVKVADESFLSDASLLEFDCIFLCNIGSFNSSEADRLSRYLSAGGSLVFFLGDQVQPAAYNRALSERSPAVLPMKIVAPSKSGEFYFTPREFRHPLLAPFARTGRNLLGAIPTWKYIVCKPEKQTSVALTFDSGDAAILEARNGLGRVIVFATDPSLSSMTEAASGNERTPWSALALYQGFPPLLRETLDLALTGRVQLKNIEFGRPISGRVTAGHSATVNIVDPAGQSESVSLQLVDDQSSWSYLPKSLGVHTREYANVDDESFAVNLAVTAESSLSRVRLDALAPLFTTTGEPASNRTVVPGNPPAGVPLFRYCLGLVLILLCIESVLCWLFGWRESGFGGDKI